MTDNNGNWQSVTVLRKKKVPTQSKDAVNQARRTGAQVETQPKFSGGTNKKAPPKNAVKLDQETESFRHAKVSMEVGKAIAKGRQLKALTQKELAARICEKPQVVAEYESGKCIPSKAILSKIERVLGVKVRGKDKGHPLSGK